MKPRLKETLVCLAAMIIALFLALSPALLSAQTPLSGPPPSTGGFFPLSQVKRGMKATAWTVFTGSQPEAMDVEILGVLRGARGPGRDMILAQLHGTKPEYTGVVAGMSGSPVYIGNQLLGSLSYRIGQFSKDPIAGITPIEQMLEVRDLPIAENRDQRTGIREQGSEIREQLSGVENLHGQTALQETNLDTMQAMETPLLMSGFRPEAIRLWQQKTQGTGMEMVAAGGSGASTESTPEEAAAARASLQPGSAVSAQLVRGDLEIAATCTVTYIDPKQLLACGHPILQAGPVSLPMTTADVVATLASPMNAFKIVNTGANIGAFTEDRDAAIRGVFGVRARMIPVHLSIQGPGVDRKLNIEMVDLPAVTPQAMLVSVYEALLETNESTADTSYHLTGGIDLEGHASSPLDLWASGGDSFPAAMVAALLTGDRFARLYSNSTRQSGIHAINLHIEVVPRRVQVDLESVRLVSGNIVHAGDTVTVEATLRPWQQAARNLRISISLPARLQAGNLRLLVSDSGTLDRTLNQPRSSGRAADLEAELTQAQRQHPADHIYISILVPETQAGIAGQTLTGLPLSISNVLEPLRIAQDVNLNGESVEVAGDAPAGGVLNGFQLLNLRIEPGSGLN